MALLGLNIITEVLSRRFPPRRRLFFYHRRAVVTVRKEIEKMEDTPSKDRLAYFSCVLPVNSTLSLTASRHTGAFKPDIFHVLSYPILPPRRNSHSRSRSSCTSLSDHQRQRQGPPGQMLLAATPSRFMDRESAQQQRR